MRAIPEYREQLMQRVILGESEKVCARSLGWSKSKVNYHREQIMKKYNARNMAQAVYLWMKEKQEDMA